MPNDLELLFLRSLLTRLSVVVLGKRSYWELYFLEWSYQMIYFNFSFLGFNMLTYPGIFLKNRNTRGPSSFTVAWTKLLVKTEFKRISLNISRDGFGALM